MQDTLVALETQMPAAPEALQGTLQHAEQLDTATHHLTDTLTNLQQQCTQSATTLATEMHTLHNTVATTAPPHIAQRITALEQRFEALRASVHTGQEALAATMQRLQEKTTALQERLRQGRERLAQAAAPVRDAVAAIEGRGRAGEPVLLPDARDKDLVHTPSSVYIAANGAFVGHPADAMETQYPSQPAIRFFKRRFGEDSSIFRDDRMQEWFPEMVAALLLKKLKRDAERATAQDVEAAVITVPAHFDHRQRKAVLTAATLAGLPVLDLIDEPVAAALHYNVKSSGRDQTVVVYDLGGGTFDMTVLTLPHQGTPEVRAKSGLTHLGGIEFTARVGDLILQQCSESLGHEIVRSDLSPRDLLRLSEVAEKVKIDLCMPRVDVVRHEVRLAQGGVEVQITRPAFEATILQHIQETEEVTLRCLREVGLTPRDVDTVLLVGGSSMVPLVHGRMRQLFNRPEQVKYHEPTRAVARGAALRACQLSGEARQHQIPAAIRGVTGYNVGVLIVDPHTRQFRVDTLIEKNMPLPTPPARRRYFTTRPDQDRIVLEVVHYLDTPENARGREPLELRIPTPQRNYPVEVEVRVLEDGTIAVRATDPRTRQEIPKTFPSDSQEDLPHLAGKHLLVQSMPLNVGFE